MKKPYQIEAPRAVKQLEAADSDDVDQSFRSHADQIGAKRRRALSVWNSDRHQSRLLLVFSV